MFSLSKKLDAGNLFFPRHLFMRFRFTVRDILKTNIYVCYMENQEPPVQPGVFAPESAPVNPPQQVPAIDPFASVAPPPMAAPQPTEAPVRKSSTLLWSIVGVVALLVVGSMAYILVRMPKSADRIITQVAAPTFTSKNLFTIQPGEKLTNPVLFRDAVPSYAVVVDDKYVFTNGRKSPRYKSIDNYAYNFKLGHLGFIADKTDGSQVIVYNGEEVSIPKGVRAYNIAMPSEGLQPRYGYEVTKDDKYGVVIDGRQSKWYDSVNRVQFSPDGTHVMYEAGEGGQEFVVFDGTESKRYGRATLVPDSWAGGRNAFQAESNCPQDIPGLAQSCPVFMVINGTEGPAYRSIGEFSTKASPDNTTFAYVGIKENGKQVLVVEGVEGKEYDSIDGKLNNYGMDFFTPVGNKLFYKARVGEDTFLVAEGTEGKHYQAIPSIFVTIGGEQVVYVAVQGCSADELAGTEFANTTKCQFLLVHNGVETKLAGIPYSLAVAANGSVAYSLARNCKETSANAEEFYGMQCDMQVVANGKPGKVYTDVLEGLSFSPQGKHVAYLAMDRRTEKSYLVVDDQEYEISSAMSSSNLLNQIFSPDDEHIFLTLKAGGKTNIIIDGTQLQTHDEVYDHNFSDDSKTVTYLYRDGTQVSLGTYTFKK